MTHSDMALQNTISSLKTHYDKLMAFVALAGLFASLTYLALRLGTIQTLDRQFDAEIDIVPKHERAPAVDTAVFEQGRVAITNPYQVVHAAWTNALFVPEMRVWCMDCKRPIPYTAEMCPFCDVKQPEDPDQKADYDGDKDGMWDAYEKKYGLDPFNPNDAGMDTDKDGFSNIAEFSAEPKTDPTNPESYPPVEALLEVLRLRADPFKLRFKSVITLPDGSLKFAINTRGNTRTYFAKLKETVEGFELYSYEKKQEEKVSPGWPAPRLVDVSELTLKRGDKLITLIKGKDVMYSEYIADLFFGLDAGEYSVKIADVFELKGKKYKVTGIDSARRNVVIVRLHDGKEFVVRRSSKERTGETSGTASPQSPGSSERNPDDSSL